MKPKSSRRKGGKQIGKLVYEWLRALPEGKSLTVDAVRIRVEKAVGIPLSRQDVVNIGNRKRKELQAEGRFLRRIISQTLAGHIEILGWEYGTESAVEKAKNTGDLLVDAKLAQGWIRRAQLASFAAIEDHALNASGLAVAKALTGQAIEKALGQTAHALKKTILLPSETRRTTA